MNILLCVCSNKNTAGLPVNKVVGEQGMAEGFGGREKKRDLHPLPTNAHPSNILSTGKRVKNTILILFLFYMVIWRMFMIIGWK